MTLYENITSFFNFENHAINVVIFGSMVIGLTSAIIGAFSFVKKKSLIGDVIAHSLLPGICIGFLISGEKDTPTLLFFALISGLFSVYFMDFVKSKSKLKNDTILAITLSIFFGFGLMLLSFIQNSGNSSQTGIDHFLFGQAAALLESDLYVYLGLSIASIISISIFYRAFFMVSFDRNFGIVTGFKVKLYELILTTITVAAVAIGIQTVGVVLMAAMLVSPASGANFWTKSFKNLIFLSGIFGSISGLFGAFISFIAPSMPTGPWIIVILSSITILSILFAPKRGVIAKFIKKKKWSNKLIQENILKALYHLGEKQNDFKIKYNTAQIIEKRPFELNILKRHLRKLINQKMILEINGQYMLSEVGWKRSRRIVKVHRLWEMYLTEKLNIAADHVHEDADSIEHIITPELETELEKMLNYPKIDPHQKEIPY